jgi:ubiquinone biosynthesis protein
MFRSLRTLRSFPRIKDITLILAKHGFHQVASYLQAPVSTRFRRVFSSTPPPTVVQQPERLRLALQDLGPTFIKFGQLLSTRPDLLPESYIEELEKLQDEVPSTPHEEIVQTVSEDLGKDIADLFESFSWEPLATASIGQVHRAVTRAGEDVVVKVRKRGLEKVVEQDLQVLRLLIEVIGQWPIFRFHDLEGILAAFDRSIRLELDFTHERFNVLRMRENVHSNDPIYVPRIYAELSSKRVLTLEYLPGTSFSSLLGGHAAPPEGEAIAEKLAVCVLRQIFEDGVFHADLHPGNLILMPDGRVGLIDFGNIGRCTPAMMDDLLLLIYYLVKRDYTLTARMILKIGQPKTDVDPQALSYDLMDVLDPYYGLSVRQIEFGGLLNSLFAISMRYQIALPPQYVILGRALMTLEGVVRSLAPGIEIVPLIEPSLLRVVRARWAPTRIAKEIESTMRELAGAFRDSPIHLSELLKKAAEGRLKVEATVSNAEGLDRRLESIGQRVPLAILVGATLIGSAILLTQADGAGGLQSTMGAVGFLGSLGLAFWMAMRSR